MYQFMPWSATGGSARVCMMERKKGSDLESWSELVEDWGTLGEGYHCTPFSNVNIFATEVSLCPNQTSR